MAGCSAEELLRPQTCRVPRSTASSVAVASTIVDDDERNFTTSYFTDDADADKEEEYDYGEEDRDGEEDADSDEVAYHISDDDFVVVDVAYRPPARHDSVRVPERKKAVAAMMEELEDKELAELVTFDLTPVRPKAAAKIIAKREIATERDTEPEKIPAVVVAEKKPEPAPSPKKESAKEPKKETAKDLTAESRGKKKEFDLGPAPTPRKNIGQSGVRSMFEDLSCEMMSVHPDEFDSPQSEIAMSLRQVAGSVLQNNRAIRVAAFKPGQARASIMSAKSVYDPEVFADWTHSRTDSPPQISISGQRNPNREYRYEVGRAGFSQHLPTGGKFRAYREWNSGTERNPGSTRTNGNGGAYVAELSQPLLNGFLDAENRALLQISRLQADMSEEEFKQKVTDIMSKAMESYWNVVQARKDIRINQESVDMAERLLERESGRKEQGISTQLDVNRAREAAASRAYNLMLSRETHTTAQENLKYYMNDKSAPVGMDIYVDAVEQLDVPLLRPSMEQAIDIALDNRPEMKNAELAIKTSEVRKRYARHTLLPEVNLTGTIRRNDEDSASPTSGSSTTNTGTDWSMGVGFSMPIGNMKARANVRIAESELAQNEEDKKNIRDQVITEVRSIVKNMELVIREIPLNRRAMEAAAKVLEGEWAKLELNQTGNSDLLQAQDLVAVAERNYVQSLSRYNIYIVRLLAAQGTLLEKMGVAISSD